MILGSCSALEGHILEDSLNELLQSLPLAEKAMEYPQLKESGIEWAMVLMAGLVPSKHQWLKHAAVCCSTCFWGLLMGVLKHAAACCSTPKIGFGRKYWTEISIPSLCSCSSEMDSTLVVKWCICD